MKTGFILIGTVLFAVTHSIQAQAPPPQVAGRVTQADNGAPIEGAIVTLAQSVVIGPWESNFLTTRTNKDGDYRFDNVADFCCYQISVSANGLVSLEYRHEGALQIDSSTHLQGIDFRLLHEAVIRGTVVDREGKPVANLPVAALGPPQHRWEQEHLGAWAKTDALGKFVIKGLPPGGYRICANEIAWYTVSRNPRLYYRETWYGGDASREGAMPIDLKEGEERNGLRITVEPETRHKVVVRPSGPTGSTGPVRYEVTLERRHYISIKKADGSYAFPDLPPGHYTLKTTAWGPIEYMGRSEKDIDITNSDVTAPMRVGGLGEIAGTVRWNGAPVETPGGILFLIESEDGGIRKIRADAQGRFDLPKVLPGQYVFIPPQAAPPQVRFGPAPRSVQCSGKPVSVRSPLEIGDHQKVLDCIVTLASR